MTSPSQVRPSQAFELRAIRPWLAALALLALSACAPNNLFVLLEDDDGKVGAIQVQNEAGAQTLNQAGQATGLDRAGQEPVEPFVLEEDEIREVFGEALDAQPEPPVTFLLYFRTGTSELTPESQALIPDILRTIDERETPPRIAVVGHTDTLGAASVNAALSLDRANVVRDLLLSRDLDPDFVEATSHGENNPLVPTADEVSEPRNRRVEVTIR
ncbi:OmpA family protein [Denitrobaculum tricleocarpae]|uniref:OmpA family protein n=1 Tax=Denitrobaculum tricleocarpae TaxID=2591009 RepID=A0A545ST25_9PROT|nr:OmpA family protein [Denitrobaculum tricleocarpae]TQV68107.1 OmpA family protein [Denitrobaculum tricleocarpae]